MMPPKISLSQNKSHANDAGQKKGSSWTMKGKADEETTPPAG
jgi:hypothetical protein